MKITLAVNKSVEQNAQLYFEKAKLSRKKLEGARKALSVSLVKLEEVKKEKDDSLDKINQEKEKRESAVAVKREWYEKFRWFFSSEGFLIIGGRDSTTNEIVVKKHTGKDDILFHTDMAGSPFFVIKAEGKPVGEATMQEVADATLCFSRAWKMGLITTPTFWVKPEQVTKEANSGEYLPKGAFVIRGKTNYMNPNPNCAIGLMEDGKVMCAPISAVKKNCKVYVQIVQGEKKPSDIARLVKKKIGGDLDEIIKILPSGSMDVKQ